MEQKKIFKNKKYVAFNLILFAVLYLTVTYNKEIIRPIYGNTPIIGIITGSFSNFIAAYIISLFSMAAILSRKLNIKKGRIVFYSVSIIVFILLMVEEFYPYVGASKTYDIYDIIMSGLGSFIAIVTFEIIIKMQNKAHLFQKVRIKERKPKTILILTGVGFLANGIYCLENKLITLAILSLSVGLLNFVAIPFLRKHPFPTKFSLMIINSVFALLTSYLLFLADKNYIQYGWLVVFIVYSIASFVFYRKHMTEKKLL